MKRRTTKQRQASGVRSSYFAAGHTPFLAPDPPRSRTLVPCYGKCGKLLEGVGLGVLQPRCPECFQTQVVDKRKK